MYTEEHREFQQKSIGMQADVSNRRSFNSFRSCSKTISWRNLCYNTTEHEESIGEAEIISQMDERDLFRVQTANEERVRKFRYSDIL